MKTMLMLLLVMLVGCGDSGAFSSAPSSAGGAASAGQGGAPAGGGGQATAGANNASGHAGHAGTGGNHAGGSAGGNDTAGASGTSSGASGAGGSSGMGASAGALSGAAGSSGGESGSSDAGAAGSDAGGAGSDDAGGSAGAAGAAGAGGQASGGSAGSAGATGDPCGSGYVCDTDTATSLATGLRWKRVTEAPLSWNAAVGACQTTYDTTWRLPTIDELQGLVEIWVSPPPVLEQMAFPNSVSSNYWSSSTQPSGAELINFSDGVLSTLPFESTFSFRCVQGS